MRMVLATAAAVLTLGCGSAALADDAPSQGGDIRVLAQVASAQAEMGQGDYETVIEALQPDLKQPVFQNLSGPMRYQVLKLYARALYGLKDWDEAHEAFVDLTWNPNATRQDWMLRMDTAMKVGDVEDAALAHDRIQDAASDDSDPVA